MDKEYLGIGMKFPPQINKATGRFVTVAEDQSVRESIYLILMTQLGERPLHANFGSTLMDYTFMDVNLTRINMMIRSLREQILNQEPRIENLTITPSAESGDGRLILNIGYVIASSHQKDSLVFPFYLNQSADVREDEPESYEFEPVEEIEY